MGPTMITRAIVLIPAGATPAELLRPIAGLPAVSPPRAGVSGILRLGELGFAGVREAVQQDAQLLAYRICPEDQSVSALIQLMPELDKT